MPDNKIFRCKTLSFINQTMHTRESWAALWKIKKYQNIETQLFPLNLRKPKIVCYVYKPLCRINFYGSIHLIFRFQKLGGLLFPLLHPIADVMLKFMFYTYDHWREGEADLHLECKSLVWAGVGMISALLGVRNVLFDFYLVNDLWFYGNIVLLSVKSIFRKCYHSVGVIKKRKLSSSYRRLSSK